MKNVFLTLFVAVVVSALVGGSVVALNHPAHDSDSGTTSGQVNSDNILPYFKVNGVARFLETKKPVVATTTICAMRSPVNATSTLQSATLQLDVASTSATSVDIAKANTPYATTTAIGSNYAVAANAQAFINASTAPSGTSEVFAPGQYLVIGMRGGISAGDSAGTGFAPQGTCSAVFQTAEKI